MLGDGVGVGWELGLQCGVYLGDMGVDDIGRYIVGIVQYVWWLLLYVV